MIANLKEWKTTTVGIVIIVSCLLSIFLNHSLTWTDTSFGLAIGIGLLFSPDIIIDKIGNLFKILIIVFLSSCMSEKKLAKICSDKYPVKDSIIVIEKIDTTYEYIEGDSIRVPYIVNNVIKYIDTICPEKKVKTIVKYKEKVVYQENTAKSTYYKLLLDSVVLVNTKQNEKIIKQGDKITDLKQFKHYTIGILLLILILILLRLALKFYK